MSAPCGILNRVTRLVCALSVALLLASAALPALDVTRHLEAGRTALEAGRWTAAEMSFRRAAGEDPGSLEAQIGVARAVAGRGEVEVALSGLRRVAEGWIRAGAYADATRLLEVGSGLGPPDRAVLVMLGRARVLNRRYLAAEEPLARVYDSGQEDPEAMLYYAAALWENGRLARAEEVLRRAVESGGEASPALYQLGRLLLWQSRFDEAIALLRRCVELAPEAVDVRLDLARGLAGAGADDEALAAFTEAVRMAPQHSEIRYGLAMALLRAGDRSAAQAELATYRALYEEDQRRTRDQGLSKARIARGRELLRQRRADDAIALLRDLGESADSLAVLASALRMNGDLEGAVRKLERALVLEPGRTDLRALLNETRLELRRTG